MVMTGCQENKSCSKVLNFLERLDDRIRCTHKETTTKVGHHGSEGVNRPQRTKPNRMVKFQTLMFVCTVPSSQAFNFSLREEAERSEGERPTQQS